ncbi:leucine carboxyl methyltransferase [Chitinophaga niastensis]|uniref:Leucine carboxyl methyltransferase n=1 Tax=Chitinophaga niastensis TaxID=536980 RepID=A0A2P8HNT3_CHINA|nr:class I SAM-dependent methyltransferase [Chitinophaga niastensis]PSL47879.1 leucine carboxyl methyltransferase [Chitinophaga niastensis]
MAYKLKVPSTSRLVLEHALPLYTSPLQQQYIDAIDFSETSSLSYDLRRSYPHFSEAVCYRKLSIREMIRERMPLFPAQQVLILGAGLDPLSLYLLENYRSNIIRIFEVDNGYIAEKKKIYDEILPQEELIEFIKCDVTDTALLSTLLAQSGYQEDLPSIIIFEGVIHYITNEEFIHLMELFKTPDKRNIVIVDFSLATEEVPAGFLQYHQGIITVMEAYINGRFNVNNRATITALLSTLGARLERMEPLCYTEKKITGSNHFFHAPGEGIMEMVIFHL